MKLNTAAAAATVLASGLAASALGQATAHRAMVTDAAAPVEGMTIVEEVPLEVAPSDEPRVQAPQMPGFPITVPASSSFSPSRGAVLADLTGDGQLEVLSVSTAGALHAWHNDGTPVDGFPVSTIGFPQYAPSVADLDGDGSVEIVLHTRGTTSGGRLYVLDNEGQTLPGFPLSFNNNNVPSSPSLHDLDGDGVLEIISAERDYPIGHVHIVRPDGTEWGGNWPFTLDHVPTGTPAVGDVDGDGEVEIFFMSYDSMYLVDTDGEPLPGWPQGISGANFSYQSAALADLDDDGDLEIAVGAHQSSAGTYVFHHDGSLEWFQPVGTWTYGPPTVTDLEGDGELEVVSGRAGVFGGVSDAFWAWDAQGNVKSGFPYTTPDHGGGSEGPYTAADVDGDGSQELFADHNVMVDGEGFLFGVDAQGNDLADFPLRVRGFTHMDGATIGDVDGDGDYELAVLSTADGQTDVNLFDLPGTFATSERDWPTYHARNSRGGLYGADDCPADLDGDGVADVSDFFMYLDLFAAGDSRADMDGDGSVDVGDFFAYLDAFAAGC